MSIRPQDVLYYGGGECLQRFGVPFWRMTRSQDVVRAVTRSGAVGPFVDKDGVLRQAAADQLRIDWADTDADQAYDTPTILLSGPERVNLMTADDLTTWGTSGTPLVATTDGPDGGASSAYTVTDNDGGATEYITSPTISGGTFSGDGTKAVVFVIRENTHPGGANPQTLNLRDTTAGAYRLELWIDSFTGGEPDISANVGTHLANVYLGDGYWIVLAQTTSATAANAHQVWITPTSTSSDTGSIDVYRVNLFDDDVPSASILDQSETHGAETIAAADFPTRRRAFKTAGATFYTKFIERGTSLLGSTPRVWHIGSSTGTADPRMALFGGGGNYTFLHDNGPTSGLAQIVGTASIGQLCELLAIVNPDGSIELQQSIAGAAATSDSDATAIDLTDDFADSQRWLNAVGSSSPGMIAVAADKGVLGVRTMAEMRNLFAYDSDRAVL